MAIKNFILLLVLVYPAVSQDLLPLTQQIAVIEGGAGTCPSLEAREEARENLTTATRSMLQTAIPVLPTLQPQCGQGHWRRVAFLNMTDPNFQCPSEWAEYSDPVRSCGRRTGHTASCDSTTYRISELEYSKVCGRAIGYILNTVDGFFRFIPGNKETADDNYVDGLSVTHGFPRTHIWTFAAGHGKRIGGLVRCPCQNSNRGQAPLPPTFVGENYFCDSEDNGALWDGEDCRTSCCTFNSPPWFKVQLNQTSTDDIELRICSDQHRENEDTHIEFIELYIQ